MLRKKILYSAFALVILVYILHVVALKFYFYWQLPWFDSPMHFLGGIFTGLIVLYVYMLTKGQENILEIKENTLMNLILITIAIVGIVWEVWEYSFGLSFTRGNDFFGTIEDLYVGVIGALALYFFAKNYLVTFVNKN